MVASQLAPTTYQGRRSLPASTVVTQYRLDKAGKRWCRQDDITLSDRQVGRERTPTRPIAGRPRVSDIVAGHSVKGVLRARSRWGRRSLVLPVGLGHCRELIV